MVLNSTNVYPAEDLNKIEDSAGEWHFLKILSHATGDQVGWQAGNEAERCVERVRVVFRLEKLGAKIFQFLPRHQPYPPLMVDVPSSTVASEMRGGSSVEPRWSENARKRHDVRNRTRGPGQVGAEKLV